MFLYAVTIVCLGAGLYIANDGVTPLLFISMFLFILGYIVYFILLGFIKNALLAHRKYIGTPRQDYLEYYMVGILVAATSLLLATLVSVGYFLLYKTVPVLLIECVKASAILTVIFSATHIAGSIAPRKDLTTVSS